MLKGKLQYNSGNGILVYNIEGVDSVASFQGRLESSNYNAMEYLTDAEVHDIATHLPTRRFDVSLGKCKIEGAYHPSYETVEGLTIKEGYVANTEFFGKLASIIRYVKAQCNLNNEVGNIGFALASDEFVASVLRKYSIPLGDSVATVTLKMGYINSMHFETNGFKMDLEDEYVRYQDPIQGIDHGVFTGISYNPEHLGFVREVPYIPADDYTTSMMYKDLEEIIARHPDKSFEWLRSKNYSIVTDDNLDRICEYIMAHKGYVYYDTETTGLNFTFKCEIGEGSKLVGLILSVIDGESFYFPVRMKTIPNLCDGDDIYFMEHYMRPILEGKDLVVHNLVFDWRVSYVYGINANIKHDTQLIFKLTVGTENKDLEVGLKPLTTMFLKRDSLELSDLVKTDDWGESEITFDDLPPELVKLYACADTDNTRGLFEYADKNNLLQRYGATQLYEIELWFSYANAYQQYYGHRVDVDDLEQLHKDIEVGQAQCMKDMVELVGWEFNPNSPSQLTKIMYEQMGIPPQYSRETGRLTTDKNAMKTLKDILDENGNEKYPFVHLLLKFRDFEAVRKIIDSYPEIITPDGFLFSSINQFLNTGRLSVSVPNYQSYNDEMKKYIVPRDGFYMTDQDYSSVEARILVSIVGNTENVELFKDPDFDYHRSRASRMFSVPYEAVSNGLRKQSKGVNFGLLYGMGDPSLGLQIFGEENQKNTRKAAHLRSIYFVGMDDVSDAMERWRNDSVKNGYSSTFFGRRRYFDKGKFSKSKIKRQGGNHVIQGTAADIYKKAVGDLFRRICKEGWLGKVLLTAFVHDELLAEVSNEIHPKDWLRVSQEEFQVKVDGWCPLYMGFGFGANWYTAKKIEIPIGLQTKIIEDYDSLGLVWRYDAKDFASQIPALIDKYNLDMFMEYLTDSSNYGGFMKPSMSGIMTDILQDELGKKNVPHSIVEQVSIFAELHKLDVPIGSFTEPDATSGPNFSEVSLDYADFIDDLDESEISMLEKQRICDERVKSLGLYLDLEDKEVKLKMPSPEFLKIIRGHVNTDKQGYRVFFVDYDKQTTYATETYLTSQEVTQVQNLYIQYFHQLALNTP